MSKRSVVLLAIGLIALSMAMVTGCGGGSIVEPTIEEGGLVLQGVSRGYVPFDLVHVNRNHVPLGVGIQVIPTNGVARIFAATIGTGGLQYVTPTTKVGNFDITDEGLLRYTGTRPAQVVVGAIINRGMGTEPVRSEMTLQYGFDPSIDPPVIDDDGDGTIIIKLPDGTVIVDGSTITVGPNGIVLILIGHGPYTANVVSGPVTVNVVNNTIVICPIHGTAPGDYPIVIQITDANGYTITIHIVVHVVSGVTGVTITVPTTTVAPGGTMQCSVTVQPPGVNQGVVWSCDRGTITATGLYTAPGAPGSDRIVAVSIVNTSVHDTQDLTVTCGDNSGGVDVPIS